MTELNDGVPRQVTVIDGFSFSIGDTSSYSAYTRQGLVSQTKLPIKFSFVCAFALCFLCSRHTPTPSHILLELGACLLWDSTVMMLTVASLRCTVLLLRVAFIS